MALIVSWEGTQAQQWDIIGCCCVIVGIMWFYEATRIDSHLTVLFLIKALL